MPTETLIARGAAAVILLAYAICFAKIASRLGRSPLLFGALAVVPALNLVALAWLAFRDPPDTA